MQKQVGSDANVPCIGGYRGTGKKNQRGGEGGRCIKGLGACRGSMQGRGLLAELN